MNRNKRLRRTANEINRYHQCSVAGCGKSYGSEGSLNQHLKIKHPELIGKEEQENEYSYVAPLKENLAHNTPKVSKKK